MSKRFVARRVAVAVATLAAIIVFNFFLFRAVGDPRNDLLRVPRMTPERAQAMIEERGSTERCSTQYGIYVGNTLRGELEVELPLETARSPT